MVLEEADRTPEEAARINPGLKRMVSAKKNPSCCQMSFQKLGKLRHHVTGLTGPSLDKQHCQKIYFRTSWIKKRAIQAIAG